MAMLYKSLEKTFIHLNTKIKILLTTSVSVTSCEQSFAELKLIKMYWWNAVSQQRLKYLALISIETVDLKK